LAFHRVVSIQLAAINAATNGDSGEELETVGGDCSNPVAAVPLAAPV